MVSVPRVENVADVYPGFAAACLEHGVRSTLSLPMRAGSVAVGALNLYARVDEGFGDDDASLAGDVAAAGAAVLVNVSAYWTAFDLSAQLQQAMDSRAVIEQAKGVLMAGQRDLGGGRLRPAPQGVPAGEPEAARRRQAHRRGPRGPLRRWRGLAVSSDEVTSALEQLAAVLQSQRTLGSALAGIAEAAVVSVPGCDAASVGLSIEGRSATAAATARVALELDLVQYDTDDGPCLTAFRNIETLRLDVVEAGDTFPHFARASSRRGVVGVLSVPAVWGTEVVTTLNLYSRQRPFDQTAVSIGSVLAAQVAIAVSRSPEYAAARSAAEQAQRDVDDRTDVDVATGMLMATQGCSADQAEGLLRQTANQEAATILQIAHRIIDQHNNSR